MIIKEELGTVGSIDIDNIGNFEDLLRVVFIHKECRNRNVFVDGGELANRIIVLNQQIEEARSFTS